MPSLKEDLLRFDSLRRDWYTSNQTLSRAVLQTILGRKRLHFVGFPRQWIPVFEWYDLPWSDAIPPLDYVPLFSDGSEEEVCQLVAAARANRSLRLLVEATSALDPIVSDLLYIVDNSVAGSGLAAKEAGEIEHSITIKKRRLYLTSWQSYGRPSVRALERAAARIRPRFPVAVVLPCSLARPYDRSQTHKRLYRYLASCGLDLAKTHRIVMTALGIIPEELWSAPQVLAYDTGVPDIYRLLRLGREYFAAVGYSKVLDCVQFKPYADILGILHREGIIANLQRVTLR
jgi:hypothetical protein